MKLVRTQLTANDLQPANMRYNVGSDTVQTLINGTWTDTPTADPRTNPGGLYPPLATADPRCDAAANMTAKIKAVVNMRLAISDQALLVSSIIGLILLIFPPLGLVIEIVWGIAELLLTFSATELATAFTDTVYTDIQCDLYQQLDTSGQLTADGLTAALALLNVQHPGIVYNVVSNIIAGLGYVGMDNVGATGEETGDCSTCDNWCKVWDFTVEDGVADGWQVTSDAGYTLGHYVAGVGWVSDIFVDSGSTYYWLYMFNPTPIDNLIGWEITYTKLAQTGSFVVQNSMRVYNSTVTTILVQDNNNTLGTDQFKSIAVGSYDNVGELDYTVGSGTNPTGIIVTRMRAVGAGTNPWGANNC